MAVGGSEFMLLIGCAILIFILYQLWILVKYAYARYKTPEEKRKFPVLPLVIFVACCLFYTIALLFSYSP